MQTDTHTLFPVLSKRKYARSVSDGDVNIGTHLLLFSCPSLALLDGGMLIFQLAAFSCLLQLLHLHLLCIPDGLSLLKARPVILVLR